MDNVIPFTLRPISKRMPSNDKELVKQVWALRNRLEHPQSPIRKGRPPQDLDDALVQLNGSLRFWKDPCGFNICDCRPGDPDGCRAREFSPG